MALIKCDECGREVSTKAASCPGCGAPVEKKDKPIAKKDESGCVVLIGLVVCVLIYMIIFGIFGGDSSEKAERVDNPRQVNEARRRAEFALERRKAEEKQESEETVTEVEQKAEDKALKEEKLKDYMDWLEAAEVTVVRSIEVKKMGGIWEATLEVGNQWHVKNYQVRLQVAQEFWAGWASIVSPEALDSAYIKLVDLNGNQVGGSGTLVGSSIWVQE